MVLQKDAWFSSFLVDFNDRCMKKPYFGVPVLIFFSFLGIYVMFTKNWCELLPVLLSGSYGTIILNFFFGWCHV